jgi:hypothetical protein
MPYYDVLFDNGLPAIGELATLEDAKMAGYSATERGGTFKVIEVDLNHDSGRPFPREVFDSGR